MKKKFKVGTEVGKEIYLLIEYLWNTCNSISVIALHLIG